MKPKFDYNAANDEKNKMHSNSEFLPFTVEASNLFSQFIFTTRTSGAYWTTLTTRVDIFLLLVRQDVSTFLFIRRYYWHPSVLSDYGIARWKHLLLWLERPILEWHSFPQVGQMKVESLCPSCCFIFLLLLFSSVLDVSVSSKVSRPSITATLQADLCLQEFPKSLYRCSWISGRVNRRLWITVAVCKRGAFLPQVHHIECPLGFWPPPFYKHAPAIAGVAVSIESTCLADLLSQEPQCLELVFPGDVQNASEVAQVEGVEFVLMPCV